MTILQKIQSLITAANNTTGESDTTLTDAVQTLVDGYGQGGGGSGYAKKTGSFVLTSDYTYEGALSGGSYTGSLLVDTGLSKIYSVILWTDEWASKTMDVNGVGCYFAIDKPLPTSVSVNSPAYYYLSYGVFKANTNYYYTYTDKGGIVLHSASADVPEGYFGFQCRTSAYPIRAGHTVRWEAVGEE